jgi:hypothetical protein
VIYYFVFAVGAGVGSDEQTCSTLCIVMIIIAVLLALAVIGAIVMYIRIQGCVTSPHFPC